MPHPEGGRGFPSPDGPVELPYDPWLDTTDGTVGERLARHGIPAGTAVDLLGRGLLTLDGDRPVHAIGQPTGEGATVVIHADHLEQRAAG